MVLAGIFEKRTYNRGRKQGLEEGRGEGRQMGREEMNQTWAEWNRCRMEAEAQGEPFTEPSPDEVSGGAT